jgi:energy-coupling factor transporter ATP-binding protein EcfA2
MTDSPHVETYEQVLDRRRQLLQERNGRFLALSARWNGIGNLRLLLFVLAAGLGLWWLLGDTRIAGYLAIPLAIAFVALVIWHRKVGQERRLAGLLAESAQEGVWRLERDWEHLPIHHETVPDPGHPYAIDLDLFGRGSLMHLVDTTVTPVGRTTLGSWLLKPAGPEPARDRQQAVAELARMGDLRDRLATEPRLAGAGEANPEPFIAWASDRPWLDGKVLLRLSALIGPVALLALLAAQLTGNLSLPLWMIPLAANLLISQLIGGETAPPIERAGSQRGSLRGYAALLRVLEEVPFSAPLLGRLRDQVRTEGHSPADSLGMLSRITRWWMPRSSLAYLPSQAFFAWDLNYLSWLERWQRSVGPSIREWLTTAGELEALTSLAALSADHPDWVFPALEEESDRFESRDLGHPLLPDDERVVNDVTVGPAGTFLLVTGSNMSGKSTLLRSIGITIVLAQAGGPVCASALTLPPVSLWTSVRVQDSLQAGVSFFMAELLRLKQIVDSANARKLDEPRIFFILDEMLQGTNTAERQIAARQIIRHLVEKGSLGAVSTHDLTLADGPELAALAVPAHLTETVQETHDGPAMVFDYRLRPGVARSTNALKLMDVVGFDFGDEPHPAMRIERQVHHAVSD